MKLGRFAVWVGVFGVAVSSSIGSAEPELTRQQRVRASGAGGATTVYRFDTSAFSLPAPNLSIARRTRFFAGNSFFTQAWILGPASASARDGLGPLFNTNTCQSCHLKDGRGRPPEPGEPMVSMLIRVSARRDTSTTAKWPKEDEARSELLRSGIMPHPRFGEQIQNRAVPGFLPEAEPRLRWSTVTREFADGTPYQLVRPELELEVFATQGTETKATEPPRTEASAREAEFAWSARVAPALVGMGLLEGVAEDAVLVREDPDDADGDGISGRANRVWDRSAKRVTLGRFGWKAGQPNVRQQVAAAFAGDLGIGSELFPDGPCAKGQRECLLAQRRESSPELSPQVLDLVTFYVSLLGVPGRRSANAAAARRGETLFAELGCAACHTPELVTEADGSFPELRAQRIQPYTDLLLHDMGAGLADGRSEFEATGREWRTPPLWGIGLIEIVSRHTRFLHDGRARNLEEAILWHGGEAERARDAYRALRAEQRSQLLFFLRSL